ncbi:hypothetical protein HY441_02315 [Candidatus Microgenomates bacterium]|nr:hypothetical protein [Candidatus Microgenomates bacterium]
MKKPTVFYHVSTNREIEEFHPRNDTVRDLNEGPVIFACPDKVTAALFSVKTDDSWVASGFHNDVPYIAVSDEERFRKLDRGGTIYYLPGDTFTCDPELGMREKEWTSKVPVKPMDREHYDSGLELMLRQGVQVYFVDPPAWRAIKESDDHGFTILQGLISENQKRDINVMDLRGRSAA